MHAVLEILGKQFKIKKNQYIYVPKFFGNIGDFLIFNKIFFLFNNNNIIFNKNVKVIIKIISHFRDNKIIIF